MRNVLTYNRLVVFIIISLTLVGCIDDTLTGIDLRPKEHIGFSASLYAETRIDSSRGESSNLSIVEQEWPLFNDSDSEQTRGSIVNSLEGLEVGMYAHSYNSNGTMYQELIMDNRHFKFIDKEVLESVDDPIMWSDPKVLGSSKLRVYGYAPYSTSLTQATINGQTTITYTADADVTKHMDIIATDIKEVPNTYEQNIPITFQHILTGVRFKVGFACTVTSLKVVGVNSTGTYTIGDAWSNQTTIKDYTLPIPNGGKTLTEDAYITASDEILMMIPQALTSDAKVIMEYKDGSTTGKIEASLNGLKWEKGALVTYTIHKSRTQEYVYFDLHAGNVDITHNSYKGYVYVGGVKTEVYRTEVVTLPHFYIYQSTSANKDSYGYVNASSTVCRLPSYSSVKVGNQPWSDYITNNTSVEAVIEAWDAPGNINNDITADINATIIAGGEDWYGKSYAEGAADNNKAVRKVGRTSTPHYINVHGGEDGNPINCDITIDNIYSRYQVHSVSRTKGGITYLPTKDNSVLKINMVGDNRVGAVHYFSGSNDDGLYYNNKLHFQGSGSLTVACVDFYKGTSAQSTNDGDKVEGYFSNYWCTAIGGNDGGHGNTIGIVIDSGTIFAGTTQAENCTAIGGGGNDRGYVTINGGSVTAVVTSTGTAIGGGIGYNSTGGEGNVTITGGNIYAYNHANEWEIPSAAIGSGGSSVRYGGKGTVKILGGHVYAQSALGTAIGGGSSNTEEGGDAEIEIRGNSYVIARSISAVDKKTGNVYPPGNGIGGGTGGYGNAYKIKDENGGSIPSYGGSATVTISGNPTIRTGSVGGGKANNKDGKIGNATITVSGGDISAQFVMAGGADPSKPTVFTMSGGTIRNSDVKSEEFYHSSDNGGAVYMEDGTFTMTGGEIINCLAENGGAVYIKKSDNAIQNPKFTMENGLIEDCEADYNGGAVYLEGGSVSITGGSINGNLARDGNGGGIYIAKGDFKMSNAVVSYNSALRRGKREGNGGGVYATSPSGNINVTISSGSIIYNSSDKNGGGVCVDMSGTTSGSATVNIGGSGTGPNINYNNAIKDGGGLYAIGTKANVTIDGGSISDNSVSNYVPNEDVANEWGTVVLNDGEVTHVVVSFDLNTSDTGATLDGEKNYQNIVTATNSYLKAPTPSRPLYNFGGWNSRADGLGAFYTDGQAMNIDKDITLYAIWIAQ